MLRFLRQASKLPLSSIGMRSASTYHYLDLEHTEKGYSLVKMNRKPVNSFNLDFINEMIDAIDNVEKLPESRGLVLTSNLKVYSAGLDLTELYNPNQDASKVERLRVFWTGFQELNLRLHQSPLVTIAAINGPAPAGGCAISLNCDYRIMADGKFTIGLNETQVGLVAPLWLCKSFINVVGYRAAEKYLSLGTLLKPQDALKVGMIDQVVPAEELMSTVDAEMKKWLAIPEIGRTKTKELMRREYINDFVKNRADDLEGFTQVVNDPRPQKVLGMYLKALQGKMKK